MKHYQSATSDQAAYSHSPGSHSRQRLDSTSFEREISRLLSAAIVSPSFAKSLLQEPVKAIDAGYQGHEYQFGLAERQLIGSIRASTIQEFAVELIDRRLSSESPAPVMARASDLGNRSLTAPRDSFSNSRNGE